jgi:hypothetical protein
MAAGKPAVEVDRQLAGRVAERSPAVEGLSVPVVEAAVLAATV